MLGRGEINRAVHVSAHRASAAAEAAIVAKGGSVTKLPMPFSVRPAASGNQFTNR